MPADGIRHRCDNTYSSLRSFHGETTWNITTEDAPAADSAESPRFAINGCLATVSEILNAAHIIAKSARQAATDGNCMLGEALILSMF